MIKGKMPEITVGGVPVAAADLLWFGAQGVCYGKSELKTGQEMTIRGYFADRSGMIRAAELENLRATIGKMPLWFTSPCGGYGNPALSHVYDASFLHAHSGPGVWTDSFGDVCLSGLIDTPDTEGDFTSHWGSRIDIAGPTQHVVSTRVLTVCGPARSPQLDRLDRAFKDAVSSAKMELRLTGATVEMRELTCQLTPFDAEVPGEGETIQDSSWDYYSLPSGGEKLGTYYLRLKTQSTSEGLQVGLFGLRERAGVVLADFLGGGGGITGLDPTSEKTQVVDCPGLVSAYLEHRANYIGFFLCFIPAELSFSDIVGPFGNATDMLTAVHDASHSTTTMTPIGWNQDVAGGEKIFTGTSSSWCVSWTTADSTKGVVKFDPDKVNMQTDSLLLYDAVPSA